MNRKALRHVKPIKITKMVRSPLNIIIPAAGMGTRMKSFGPQSLLRINDQGLKLIDYQLKLIHKVFERQIHQIILVAGHGASRVFEHVPNNLIKVENERYENTNIARSLSIGLRACTSNRILIIYGDLVFNEQALKTTCRDKSWLLTGNLQCMTDDEVGCTSSNEIAQYLSYNIPTKWGQIAYFTGKELTLLKQILWETSSDMMYGFEIINKIINKGGIFKTTLPEGTKINDIDSSKDLKIIQEILT